MADVLINHPLFGSMWLSNCTIGPGEDGRLHVVGEAWDTGDVGSAYLPDDYMGQAATYNFPATCIRKDPDGLLKEAVRSDAETNRTPA